MSKYAIVIVYSDEDAGYVAVAPELPGCTAFGGTEEEALAKSRRQSTSGWTKRGENRVRFRRRVARRCSKPLPVCEPLAAKHLEPRRGQR